MTPWWPFSPKVTLIGAAVLATLAGLAWLRWDAADDARREIRGDLAVQEQTTRERADEAANDAARDGASRRLRDGRF